MGREMGEDKRRQEPGMADKPVSYNFSTWELEVGTFGVEGQPQSHNEFKASRANLGSHLKIKRNKMTIKEAVEQQKSRISWMFGEISLHFICVCMRGHTHLKTYFIRASRKM